MRRSGKIEYIDEANLPPTDTNTVPLQQLVREEELTALQRAIDGLPLPLRAAMHLKYGSGLANSDIAAVLGISANLVAVHLVRAKQILRTQLKESGHE